jgi:hypothetical protein
MGVVAVAWTGYLLFEKRRSWRDYLLFSKRSRRDKKGGSSMMKKVYQELGFKGTVGFIVECADNIVKEKIERMIGTKEVETTHSHYILTYRYGGQKYKVMWNHRRGRPVVVTYIVDQDQEDITNEIKMLMGPCADFHGTSITPGVLGYTQITFSFVGRGDMTFEEDDVLSF